MDMTRWASLSTAVSGLLRVALHFVPVVPFLWRRNLTVCSMMGLWVMHHAAIINHHRCHRYHRYHRYHHHHHDPASASSSSWSCVSIIVIMIMRQHHSSTNFFLLVSFHLFPKEQNSRTSLCAAGCRLPHLLMPAQHHRQLPGPS